METQKEYKALAKTEIQISIEDVKKYIAPNATDKELFMFMGIAKSYGLNPLKREIHFLKYGNNAASIIVGYEVYLKRADRTGLLDGWKCWIEKDIHGEKAIIEIKRKDQSMPIHWEVYRSEFDRQQSTWKTMPTFMLKKVAIAQGFRLAFPNEIGGFPYIPEELPQMVDTTSEKLPKEIIDMKEEVPPATEKEKAPSGENKKLADSLLEPMSPLDIKLEDAIEKSKIDREKFKEWLESVGWLTKVDDKLFLSTLTQAKAKTILDKWQSCVDTYNIWLDAQRFVSA